MSSPTPFLLHGIRLTYTNEQGKTGWAFRPIANLLPVADRVEGKTGMLGIIVFREALTLLDSFDIEGVGYGKDTRIA